MDYPIGRICSLVRLRRSCECNRLEKQFLIDAYECLVAILPHPIHRGTEDEGCRQPVFKPPTNKARPSRTTTAWGQPSC